MVSRADRFTERGKRVELYSDFLIDFDRNPVTGNLARATDETAVKNSIKNIVLTSQKSWPFEPTLGSKAHDVTFEPADIISLEVLKETIAQAIQNNEPRARLISVQTNIDDDGNATATITFATLNSSTPVRVDVFLRRVR